MEHTTDWDTASEGVGLLSGQVAQLHAQMIETASQVIADETWAGAGIRSVEHFLELKTGLDRSTVTKIVKIAQRSDELPELMDSLHQGRLTLDQAAVVARHAPASYSADVADLAQYTTVSQLRRALSSYFRDTEDTSVTQPSAPESSLRISASDERFRLWFTTTDLAAGALVENAIREAKDALFTQSDTEPNTEPNAEPNSAPDVDSVAGPTLADGLIEVAHRSLGTLGQSSRASRYQVLVHLDTNGGSWLHKAGALPTHVTQRYTCEGQLVPVWETESKPVAVGRTQRIVPDRTRRLIEDRDKGCRFPGCHARGYLEVHHQKHWRDGGPTDPSNLLSLCTYHHDEHHRGSYTINGDPEEVNGLSFTDHRGRLINPQRPTPPPLVGKLPPSQWEDNLGERLQMKWVDFRPNPPQPPPVVEPVVPTAAIPVNNPTPIGTG